MDALRHVEAEPAGPSADIVRIAQEIWKNLLYLGLDVNAEPISLSGMSSVSACIQLTGDWTGAVTIQCSLRLARRIAEAMFELSDSEIGQSEVCDALGEIANMVGGNFKSVLQVSCQISLPAVAEGTNYTLVVPHSVVLSRTAFTCEGELMQVLVHRFTRPEARSARGPRH